MTTTQKVIKYCAFAFALVLSLSIIGSIAAASFGILLHIDALKLDSVSKNRVNMEETFPDAAQAKILLLNNSGGELILRTADTDVISVQAENVLDTFVITLEGDTLFIGYPDTEISVFRINFDFLDLIDTLTDDEKITVTLPEELVFTQALVDNGSGKMELNGLSAEELYLDNGSGQLNAMKLAGERLVFDLGSGRSNLSDFTAVTLTMDTGSGSVQMEDIRTGTFSLDSHSGSVNLDALHLTGDLSINSSSGSVSLDIRELGGSVSIKSGSGSVTLAAIAELDNYQTQLRPGSGNIWINGMRYSDNISFGGGDKTLSVNSGSGRVSVEFTK